MPPKGNIWRNVWIVGASSGMGLELARRLNGDVPHIAISARSADKLESAATGMRNASAFHMDVTEREAIAPCLDAIEASGGPVDLVVLAAGVWHLMDVEGFDLNAMHNGMNVNYIGVVNVLDAVLPRMLERGRGHVAIVSSVAGFRGLPKSVAYGPTKAALTNLAETLRAELASRGIKITVVHPGFVDTPMTEDNPFPMPAIMPVEEAAKRLEEGLRRGDYEIIFPRRFVYGAKLLRILPNALYFWIVRTFILKKAKGN